MNNVTKSVDLSGGIKIGDKVVKKFTVREPSAGELRGIAVLDLIRMDTNAYIELLPRITAPTITKEQVRGLKFNEIANFMEKVTDFLD